MQTGLRIDRILFKQFQQLCAKEKLRPGEAVESLVRLAVENGGIAAVSVYAAEKGPGSMIDEALFRSKLARLKTCLEGERKYWTVTHDEIDEDERESEEIAKELAELAKRPIDEGLVKKFEECLKDADTLYTDIQTHRVERWIKQQQRDPGFST